MIALSNERYEAIKNIVVNTFENFDIHCTPISGFELASQMGVTVVPYSAYSQKAVQELMMKQSEDGFSVMRNNKWYMYYNDKKPYGRINNTIMHENGHIVLDHTEDSEVAEKEANFFAKFALAPPVLIYKFNLTNRYEVAERFEISDEAADYAWDYYKKWLHYGGRYYKNYEIKLCNLFGIAV